MPSSRAGSPGGEWRLGHCSWGPRGTSLATEQERRRCSGVCLKCRSWFSSPNRIPNREITSSEDQTWGEAGP